MSSSDVGATVPRAAEVAWREKRRQPASFSHAAATFARYENSDIQAKPAPGGRNGLPGAIAENAAFRHERQFYIDGAWVEPAAPVLFDVIDPSNEEAFTRAANDTSDGREHGKWALEEFLETKAVIGYEAA